MGIEIARLDLRLRRRSTLAYTLGFAAYAVLIVALYPSFKNDTALDQLTQGNEKLTALFGASGSLTSPQGWMNANLYANLVPLFTLLMTIGYGATAVAGQDEEGLLGGVLSLPITRRRALLEKVGALLLLALPIPLVTAASAAVGGAFEVDLSATGIAGITVGAVLLAVDHGLLALAVGAWTGSRSVALGVASAAAAVGYVISSLAPVVSWVHDVRYLSPFFWAVGANQLGDGLGVTSLLLLLAAGLGMLGAAKVGLEHLDVH